jgi:hypothetical protein
MKTLSRFWAASVLALTLTLPAFAGDMHTTYVPPAPPPTSAITQGDNSTSTDGEMSTTQSGEADASDSLTEAALNLLQSVLSLL